MRKKYVKTAGLLLAVAVFCIAAVKLSGFVLDDRKTSQEVEELRDLGVIHGEKDIEYEVIRDRIDPETGKSVTEKTLIKVELPFTIDFDSLRDKNSDIIGWLYCEDTGIDYPVMRCVNNDEYLHHRPDGSWSYGGSLFIDCIYPPDLSAFNTVIHGHNMKNGSMFGRLRDFRDAEYCSKHSVFYYFAPYGTYMLEVVGAYGTNGKSYIYSGLSTREQMEQFLSETRELSEYAPDISYGASDRYITLSTCTYEERNGRFIVVCKLTEINADGTDKKDAESL